MKVQSRSLKILLVEDNPGDQDLILEWLGESQMCQFDVSAAGTLAEALHALEQAEFSAVLLDLSLPDSHGVDTIHRVRERHESTPILVLSGLSAAEARAEALRAGAQEFFSKDENPELLLAKGLMLAVDRHYDQLHERYLNTLVRENPDAVLVLDEQRQVQYANPAALQLFGRSEDELMEDVFPFTAPENRLVEIEISRPDGARHGQLRESPITWENAPAELVVIRDVTEYKQLEEIARQSQKMEAVGTLAAGVAHDFNNLLTVINGYTEMLLKEDGMDDMHRTMLQGVEEAGQRAAALTRQLLAFGRKSMLSVENLELNSVIQSVFTMIQRIIGEDIHLKLALCPEPCPILADATHMEQILLNLSVNARDAMPNGGTITVTTRHYSQSEYPRTNPLLQESLRGEDYFVLSILDDGPGIPPEVRQKIFQPFFTTKPVNKGTGLGLSTVYGIVKQMEGHIVCESHPGRGAEFIIFLPATAPHAPSPERTRGNDTASKGGNETILLVEDEAAVQEVTRHTLTAFGYQVLTAASGDEGLAIARAFEGPIHLVITDVVMPGMNGLEFAERLQQERQDIKVMFATGYTDEAIALRGVVGQRRNVLQKPYRASTLAAKIREVLDAPTDKGASVPLSGG